MKNSRISEFDEFCMKIIAESSAKKIKAKRKVNNVKETKSKHADVSPSSVSENIDKEEILENHEIN